MCKKAERKANEKAVAQPLPASKSKRLAEAPEPPAPFLGCSTEAGDNV